MKNILISKYFCDNLLENYRDSSARIRISTKSCADERLSVKVGYTTSCLVSGDPIMRPAVKR